VARIAGVNIPNQKRVPIALTYIHGIGRSKALEICTRVGIPPDRRAHEMTDDEVLRVRELVDREYTVEGDLRRQVAMNIKRLMDLGCYPVCAIAAACRCAGSGPIPTPAPARGRHGRSRARRNSALRPPQWGHPKRNGGRAKWQKARQRRV